jgi:hypothetical protein
MVSSNEHVTGRDVGCPAGIRRGGAGGELPPAGRVERPAQRRTRGQWVAAGALVVMGFLADAPAAGAQGLSVSTLAGLAGSEGSADGTGSAARFYFPYAVAVDGAGTVYVADSSNHTIRKVTAAGVATTLAGAAGVPGSVDGAGSAARFYGPRGVAVDGAGTVYVADSSNHTIRRVTAAGLVTTLAGLAGAPGSGDGTGSAARFNSPTGVAVDAAGTVYVADSSNHAIRRITAAGVVTTMAGLAGVSGSADGAGSAARFNTPTGVAVDGVGTVHVSDHGNHTIRKVTAAGVVTTLAGLAGVPGNADGTGTAARFYHPTGVAVDGLGTLYVADRINHTIRKVTAAGVVTTSAGLAGSLGAADGTGSAARFDFPTGVAVDGVGTVYVADARNHTIRRGRRVMVRSDYDADGLSDAAVYRPGAGTWYLLRSGGGGGLAVPWGVTGDVPVPGDYDGDGQTDVAVYRPGTGTWYLLPRGGGGAVGVTWGVAGDVPVPADYDGDGKTDVAVFRPSTSTWFIVRSSTGTAVGITWGISGDVPVPADYDGDGKADPAVFRPSTGTWYQFRSTTNAGYGVSWGVGGDVPVPADYDGDGKADPAVYRPSLGMWFQLRSATGTGYGLVWGAADDVPLAADYDGDGRADPTVFRASTGIWYQFRSSTSSGVGVQWGAPGDVPLAQ